MSSQGTICLYNKWHVAMTEARTITFHVLRLGHSEKTQLQVQTGIHILDLNDGKSHSGGDGESPCDRGR